MRTELTRLRGAEEEAKNNANKVTSLVEELERLRKDLQTTQKEKKAIEDWAQTYQDEMEQVRAVNFFTCVWFCCGSLSDRLHLMWTSVSKLLHVFISVKVSHNINREPNDSPCEFITTLYSVSFETELVHQFI